MKRIILFSGLGVYAIIALITTLFGLIDGLNEFPFRCDPKMAPIEYVFPTYQLGCWLGTVPK